ncbi:kinase-like domain-containing protein [Dactylonectria estremocensis]|uniref:Kinase-like domain-containing protein n=1 Tax=Dactylonectria estremocensis TaxID=1079267 RepID=A0A9P9FL47_9HYPO|nr:kinase-like domain-containing protein [Dactylonectria estremocensis]
MASTLSNKTIQDFRDFLHSEEVCRRNFEGKIFHRPESIKSWLSQVALGGSISNAVILLRAVYQSHAKFVPVSTDHILRRHALIFAILVDMGCGHMIHSFQRCMPDSYLTIADLNKVYSQIIDIVSEDATNLPPQYKEGGYTAVIDEFDKRRWAFVPATLRLGMDSAICHGKCILPYFQTALINLGGTAKVYRCKIQADLVEADLARVLEPSTKNDQIFGKYYEFAIKSYIRGYEDVYRMESQAFNGMKSQTLPGVVRYLGQYHTDEGEHSHHILLELGELDLDEYLANTCPPVLNKEIIDFWESLFKVAQTLGQIHRLDHVGEDGNMQRFNGWHGDIKPDNILFVRREFKLADFGFSEFEKEKRKAQLFGGTRTYGAPERDINGKVNANIPQSQTIDTWSFGCVLSAVATWVILGPAFYIRYSIIRQEAIEELHRARKHSQNISVPSCNDSFHDGNKVLDAVTKWHDHLRNSTRRADTISRRVLDLVDNGMLVHDPEKRLTATQLCERLCKIIELARDSYNEDLYNGRLKKESEGTLKVLLKLDVHAPAIAKPFSQVSNENNAVQDALTSTPLHRQDLTLPHQLRPSNRIGKSERFGKILSGKTANREEAIRSDSRISEMTDASEPNSCHSEKTASTRPDIYILEPDPIIQVQSHAFRITEDRPPLPPRSQTIDPDATQEESEYSYSLASQRPISAVSSSGFGEGSLSPTPRTGSHPQLNVAIVEEYWQLKQVWANQKGSWSSLLNRIPKDTFLEKHISNRDIKFVVDNSASMKPHWNNVTMVLLALAMKIGPLDKDGLDLVYTIGERNCLNNIKGQKIETKFQQSIENAFWHIDERNDKTDMAAALSRIFDDYLKDTSKKQTLLILTDGCWDGSKRIDDVENKIRNFVNHLKAKLNLYESRWFSIQFISFGNNEANLKRLQELDDTLNAEEDVVDTKPWNFPDVNKLILGSITQYGDDATAPVAVVSTPQTPTSPTSNGTRRRHNFGLID